MKLPVTFGWKTWSKEQWVKGQPSKEKISDMLPTHCSYWPVPRTVTEACASYDWGLYFSVHGELSRSLSVRVLLWSTG